MRRAEPRLAWWTSGRRRWAAICSDFLDVVDRIYNDDPHYVRPLDMDLKDRLDPKKNPFFEHAEGTVFTAYEDGKCVGRITAQIDREHLARHKDDAGFFGFLDTIDDPEVARALLARAEAWLTAARHEDGCAGRSRSRINEEIGCLVEGFDDPPVLMNPHHRPYQGGLIEQAGYTKEKDFFAGTTRSAISTRASSKAHDEIRAMPEVDVAPALEEGHRARRRRSRRHLQRRLERQLGLRPAHAEGGRQDGGGLEAHPHPRDHAHRHHRRRARGGRARAAQRQRAHPRSPRQALPARASRSCSSASRCEGAKSGRLLILGIRKKFRRQRKYAGLSLFLYVEMNDGGRTLGMTWGELGWTLEDNAAVNAGIRMMGAKKYKTYRVYTKRPRDELTAYSDSVRALTFAGESGKSGGQ